MTSLGGGDGGSDLDGDFDGSFDGDFDGAAAIHAKTQAPIDKTRAFQRIINSSLSDVCGREYRAKIVLTRICGGYARDEALRDEVSSTQDGPPQAMDHPPAARGCERTRRALEDLARHRTNPAEPRHFAGRGLLQLPPPEPQMPA